jgi:hypothetical protein
MCADLLSDHDQDTFHKGASLFATELSSKTGNEVIRSDRKEVLGTFERYFKLEEPEKQRILKQQQAKAAALPEADRGEYALYRFLFVVREFALLGFFTSERIGKEVLVFDPIPGGFKPCIPMGEVGNAWTIDP